MPAVQVQWAQGETEEFSSLSAAMEVALKDQLVWRVTFWVDNQPFRLVRDEIGGRSGKPGVNQWAVHVGSVVFDTEA